MSCQGEFLGQTSGQALNSGIEATYPPSAASGSSIQLTMIADPIEVPTDGGGYPLLNLNQFVFRFPIPAGSTVQSLSMSGGSNLGTNPPTLGVVGPNIQLGIPGPLAAGTTAQPPTVTVVLNVTGAPGGSIETTIAGTSFADWGVFFNARVQIPFLGANNVPTKCFSAPPKPVFTVTSIT